MNDPKTNEAITLGKLAEAIFKKGIQRRLNLDPQAMGGDIVSMGKELDVEPVQIMAVLEQILPELMRNFLTQTRKEVDNPRKSKSKRGEIGFAALMRSQ